MMAAGALFVTTSACLLGLIIYTKYANCSPVTLGRIKQHDQIVPYFVMDIASDIPTIPGFFLAGIVGAALSVLSAGLNCVATTIYSDFVASWFAQYTNVVSETACIKFLVLLIGALCTILMYVFEYVGSFLNVIMSVTGIVNGPLLGMFTLGMLFPKASKKVSLRLHVFFGIKASKSKNYVVFEFFGSDYTLAWQKTQHFFLLC